MTATWLDESFARINLARAKADGAHGLMRYICPSNSQTAGKIITPAERDEILHAGLDLLLNFEWYATRALEGHGAGLADGRVAASMAAHLQYPHGAAIYFSVDCDTHDYGALEAYFAGVAEGLGGHWKIGAYGSYDVVGHLLAAGRAQYGWQTLAWSGGNRNRHAVIYQNGHTWFGGSADEDLVTGACGSWLEVLAAGVPPKSKPPAHATPAPPSRPRPAARVVVVHPGDTLSAIARRFKTTVAHLAALNHLHNPNMIHAGETLHLDGQAPTVPPVAAGRRYEVRPGDTLAKIAARFDTTWQRLAAVNHITDPDRIDAGEVITV